MVIYMFYNYKIKDNVLYLYVLDNCEIGSLFNPDKSEDIIYKIKKFIKDYKINFDGVKVVLLLSGLMLGTVYLNKDVNTTYDIYKDNKYVYNIVDKNIPKISNDKKIEDLVSEVVDEAVFNITNETKNTDNVTQNKYSDKLNNQNIIANNLSSDSVNDTVTETEVLPEKIITLKRTNGEILNINLEKYLIGVIAAEMPVSFNNEALKAQAVVARTYTLKLLETGRTITDDVSTQVYKSNDELKSIWGNMYNTYYQKVKKAVNDTSGMCIKYNGSLIDAVYHSTSNGYTEDAVNVWGNSIPYLKSVTSPWDTSSSSFLRNTNVDFNKISNTLGIDFDSSSVIEIISRDESGRISKIKFNDKEFSGVELRNLLGLRSSDFDILINETGVVFTTRGYGHGVGMSQYGADGMASSGYTYEQILKHYYTGINVVQNY